MRLYWFIRSSVLWFFRSFLVHPSTLIVMAVIVGGNLSKSSPNLAVLAAFPYLLWKPWAANAIVNVTGVFLVVAFVMEGVKGVTRAQEASVLAKREADRVHNLKHRKAILRSWRAWLDSFPHSGDSEVWMMEIEKMYDEVSIAESWEAAFNDSAARWLLRRGVELAICPIPEPNASWTFIDRAIDIAAGHQNWSAFEPENIEAWRVIEPVLKERYPDLSKNYGHTTGFIQINRLLLHGPSV